MKELKKYVLIMVLAGYAGFVPAQVMAEEPAVAAAEQAPAMSAEEVLKTVAGVYKDANPAWAAKLEAMATGLEPMDAAVLTTVAADLKTQGKADWAEKVESIVKSWSAQNV